MPVRWLLGILWACGCAPVYLAPAASTPLFKERGGVSAAAFAGTSGADVQAAAAVADHVMVQGAMSEEDAAKERRRYGEASAGTFLRFGQGEAAAIAGGGYGSSRGVTELTYGDGTKQEIAARGHYLRGFAQGSIAFTSRAVDAGFVA